MVLEKRKLSLEDYFAFVDAPDHPEALFELLDGELIEKMVSQEASMIALTIGALIREYLRQAPLGRVTGPDGTYLLPDGSVVLPDVGYISKALVPERIRGPVPRAPELAVEVRSPSDSRRALRQKAERYLQNGVRLAWLVFPEDQTVEVYYGSEDVMLLDAAGMLDGRDVLPGLAIPVQDIFAE